MPGTFVDFIDDCTGKPSQAQAFYDELNKPGQTPEGLLTFFQSLGVNVTKGDCTRLLHAAKAQGPMPSEFQPKY